MGSTCEGEATAHQGFDLNMTEVENEALDRNLKVPASKFRNIREMHLLKIMPGDPISAPGFSSKLKIP